MNLRKLLLLSASSSLLALCCSVGSAILAQTAARQPDGPAAQSAPESAPAPETPPAPQADAPPAIAILMDGGNFLGIIPEDVNRENMSRYNLREPRGVAVAKVVESGPAARAGLREGDVILRFEGEPVNSIRKLNRLIDESAPEQTVRLTVSRQGSEQELSVTLGKRKDFPPATGMLRPALPPAGALRSITPMMPEGGNFSFALGMTRRLGVGTTQLTKQLADYFGVGGGRGALLTSVDEASPAARAGLKAGDVITEVDGQAVGTAGELARALNRRSDGEVTLRIVRDKKERTVKVTPERGQAIPFGAPEELVMPQIGSLDTSIMKLPELPRLNMLIPRLELPQIPKLRLAPMGPRGLMLLAPLGREPM